jgi:hypothetical protein
VRYGGAAMRAPFDLFKKDGEERFVWLEAARDLSTAKTRLRELSCRTPGEYLVFDQGSAEVVERLRNDSIRPESLQHGA